MAKRISTTDLELLRTNPLADFTWGKIRMFHNIGRYTLVEYAPDREGAKRPVSFHVYVDGNDTNMYADTFDNALLVALARGHLSMNEASHAVIHCSRILKMEVKVSTDQG